MADSSIFKILSILQLWVVPLAASSHVAADEWDTALFSYVSQGFPARRWVKACAWGNGGTRAHVSSGRQHSTFAFPNLNIIAMDIKTDTVEKINSSVVSVLFIVVF